MPIVQRLRHGSGDVTHFQPDFQNSAVPERSARAKKGSRASKSQHSTFLFIHHYLQPYINMYGLCHANSLCSKDLAHFGEYV